ncbi:phage holin family protein [Lysinibacillus pakistanensis]|uniref:Phage holin family protein n=1 Tax=Lysinibacillus pakistanensis TaxID=759811 RepID=A0AAX3WTH2_9BACI|nr:phage holin family protein [Lysinibacillus pakistanensis]MDM5229667.1 phage holin family protein [Lysinibacillus pakistanensis]WHY45239.1 phage holin family protein [Lysinibacillus pakistanensis]WHY50248.1 phage holin family protein [Lysinibacillus pakistanensis]
MDITQIIQHPILSLVPKPILYMFLAYLVFKVLDFTTGLLKTWKKVVGYKSAVMRDGIIRWIGELVGIVFVIILDLMFGLNFYLTGFTLALFLYKEGGSIAENLQTIGVDMPGIVDETLEKLNKESGRK